MQPTGVQRYSCAHFCNRHFPLAKPEWTQIMIPIHPRANDFLENTHYTMPFDLFPVLSPLLWCSQTKHILVEIKSSTIFFFTLNLLHIIFLILAQQGPQAGRCFILVRTNRRKTWAIPRDKVHHDSEGSFSPCPHIPDTNGVFFCFFTSFLVGER